MDRGRQLVNLCSDAFVESCINTLLQKSVWTDSEREPRRTKIYHHVNGMADMTDSDSSLDETDIELLRRVESDFDINLEELSQDLGLSKSAVHYRLNKLRKEGVIVGSSADLDPISLGLDMVAITDIYVRHEEGYADDIGMELAAIEGIEQVYYTMGDVDFVVISRVRDRDLMNRVIDRIVSIEGVNETSSRFVMTEVKSDPRVLTNRSRDRAKDLLTDD